jgi:radical SAM protein with 4Fe4S-binding SPASM domain
MMDAGYTVKRLVGQESLWKGKGPQLPHLDIELTERCNNACLHCYINLPANDKQAVLRELSTIEWQDILQQTATLGALSVRFTGGEPLLRDDFADLYLFARRLGMQVTLFTNARRITPELADLFARVPPRKKIEITVYGIHPESYDAVACVPGAFAEFQRGVQLLQERQIPFVVKSVLLPPNRGEIEEFEAWAATIPWTDQPPSYAVFLELRARRDSPSRNRLIRSLRFSPEQGLALLTRHETAFRRAMVEFSAYYMGPQGERLFSCGAGETGCLDAYGKYQMCMSLRHPDTVYDLKQGSLREALSEVFPRLRELRATNMDYLYRCARCFLKGLCEQCPGKSWAEHGTLDTPVENLCQVAHLQARYLGLLEEGEQAWEVDDWRSRLKRLVVQEHSAG